MKTHSLTHMFGLLLIVGTLVSAASPSSSCSMKPTRLRTNNLVDPLGVSTEVPRVSWALEATSATARGLVQSAYRIGMCSTPSCFAADVWDSGKVTSADTLNIAILTKLRPSQLVFWHVQVFDGAGNACDRSDVAKFETALAPGEAGWDSSEWLARFFVAPLRQDSCDLYDPSHERVHAPRFRAKVTVPVTVVEARAYIVGLGYYQLFIDGERVGTSQLDPGWTTYSKSVLYAVHDVTKHLVSALDTVASSSASSTHAIGIELGNGWWNPVSLKMWGATDVRGALTVGQGRGNGTTTEPMFRLKIVGIMNDGTQKILLASSSNASVGWMAGGSPTTFNDIYLGEKYDARMESELAPNSWSTVAAYDSGGGDSGGSGWAPAVRVNIASLNLGELKPQSAPPIRRQGVLKTNVVSMSTTKTNTTIVLDTGKNHAGVCRFKFTGQAGDKVIMRYGELLAADGKTLNPMTSVAGQIKGPTENKCILNPGRTVESGLHVAFQADEMILSGRSDEWTPSYSWHGFRYIELTVPLNMTKGPGEPGAVECYPMRTDVDLIANFSSSDMFLDELRTLNRNTFDSNMMSVQSDCPHRERFGYGGDLLGCGEAGLSIYDFSTFYAKRVQDFNDAQTVDPHTGGLAAFTETSPFVGIRCGGCGPGGGFEGDLPAFPQAGGPIGWQTFQLVAQLWLYKYYGDLQIIIDSFGHTRAYIEMLDNSTSRNIDHGLGDWMPVQGTDRSFTGLGFQRMSYLAFANITELLNKTDLASHYRSKADTIATQINTAFLNSSTGAYRVSQKFPENQRPGGTAEVASHNASQCGQGMALFEGFVPNHLRDKALNIMAQNSRASEWIVQKPSAAYPKSNSTTGGPGAHMTAGLFGIKWFLMSLADGGMNDLAYEVLTTPSYPGFKWMMNNEVDNATTIWESWFFSDNVFSHNHPMFASSEVWLLQSVVGIQPHPMANGFDKILIKPSPPSKLEYAVGSMDTARGRVSVSWARTHNDPSCIALNVTVPPNVRAIVHVPASKEQEILESGVLLQGGQRERASVVFEVGSGNYQFVPQQVNIVHM